MWQNISVYYYGRVFVWVFFVRWFFQNIHWYRQKMKNSLGPDSVLTGVFKCAHIFSWFNVIEKYDRDCENHNNDRQIQNNIW